MIFNLSVGEVLHIGDIVTLNVLAVEGDLIYLGLEMAEAVRSTAGHASKDNNGASCEQRRNWWELN